MKRILSKYKKVHINTVWRWKWQEDIEIIKEIIKTWQYMSQVEKGKILF